MSTAVNERSWCVVVPHHARAASSIRRRMAVELSPLIPPDLLADSMTVTAELVGNAVRHAEPLPGEVIQVAWWLREMPGGAWTVEIRVTDGGAVAWPRIQVAEPDATDGRGLAIVAALAAGWGVHRDGTGQCVWATVVESAPDPSAPEPPAMVESVLDGAAGDTSGEFGEERATGARIEP